MRPYMRAANVTWAGIDASDVKEMDFDDDEFKTFGLVRGDILLAEASGSASEVGRPAMWHDEVPGACFQNTLIRVRLADPREAPFIYWHLYNDAISGRFVAQSQGVGIHHLGATAAGRWQILRPPLEEQLEIVASIEARISKLDNVLGTMRAIIGRAERSRTSLIKAGIEGRLVRKSTKP